MKDNTGKNWSIGYSDWAYEDVGEDGPRTRLDYFVTAIDDDGRIYRHFQNFSKLRDTDRLVARIEGSHNWNGPLNSPHWHFFRVAYGSPAYIADQSRLEAETELLDRAAHDFHGDRDAAFRTLPNVMKAALL